MTTQIKAWTWRHAFCAAEDLEPNTKHVLHTLSMFMNAVGESCYPPLTDLVKYSGLDKKTVRRHIGLARDKGWIAVSQHGFRGQKWKRHEYAARWPERDLVAPCAPEEGGAESTDQDQGGGTAPPRSDTQKVGEPSPKGGGMASPKVGEQLPQDKTSPSTSPTTSPIERERADVDASAPDGEKDVDPYLTATRETWKARLHRAHGQWPSFATDSSPQAEKAWFALDVSERKAAAERVGDYLALTQKLGRKIPCTFGVYLSEKRWLKLADSAAEAAAAGPVKAVAWGKAWSAARLADLQRAPYGPPVKLTQTQALLAQQGKLDAQAELRRKRVANGWPRVVQMQDQAERFRKGAVVVPEVAALGESFVGVEVGSPLWAAWERLHGQRGWPWFGADERQNPYVYMPKAPDMPDDASPDDLARAALGHFETLYHAQRKDAAE